MVNHVGVSKTKCTYDVFLNFRGEDVRRTFICHLYQALDRKGIATFMDNKELKYGDELSPTLLKAIEESRISIVVFSKNYAASSWCLDELVKIHECIKSKKQQVWPIFYKMDPANVRHQKGSYGQAMTKHETRHGKDPEKLHKWRLALTYVANLKGQHLTQGTNEANFIEDLVSKIFNKVSPKDLSRYEHIVGRKYLVEELKLLLDLESHNITCLLGIYGTGGIGKTTLAKALYDSIYKQFEGSSFLSNVREKSKQIKGLELLQKSLLSDILEVEESKIQVKNIEEGIITIKSRLDFKRVLIILDDVDDIKQMYSLAREHDWFGLGSRIIITTRDQHLLDVGRIKKKYEVKVLNHPESLELFCQSVFRKNYPKSNYKDLSHRAIRCCKGLPLALKVLGCHLVGKDLSGWNDALDKYEKSPHEDVQKVLRISYDSLSLNEKDIFLDIVCFFNGWKLKQAKEVLDACDFNSGDGITTLVNKSLLTIDNKYLHMHDLIQAMGKYIVKEEAWNEFGERSRLWHHEDVLQVLADNNGSGKIQGIILDPPQSEEVNCTPTVFKKMGNLRILIVRNTKFLCKRCYLPNNLKLLYWENYPSPSFPSDFYPRKIVTFHLCESPSLVLKKPFKKFEHLTCICISSCCKVTEFPDVSGAMNLRELRLDRCENLVSIHESVGYLTNLVSIQVLGCTKLQSFVPTIYLPSLENLCFSLCTKLTYFPEIREMMDKPLKIIMMDTSITDLPESVEKLIGLKLIDMTGCKELRHLPSSLFMLPNFVTLKIGKCHGLRESFRRFQGSHSTCPKLETLDFCDADLSERDLSTIIYNFPNLKDLIVSQNNFVSLPADIIKSTKLASLDVSSCEKLEEISELPSSIEKVDARECNSLTWETSNMLWSQVRKEMKRLHVVMPNPKREIPEWFDYVKEGGYPVFEVRGKFPAVALAFVFGEVVANVNRLLSSVHMHLIIDGERKGYRKFSVNENHVLLYDLPNLFGLEERDVGNDWKTIMICCKTNLSLCSWGVYAYNQGIRFPGQDQVRSEEEKVRNKKRSSNILDINRVLCVMMTSLDELGYSTDKSAETSQMLLRVLQKELRASREEEGLNVEDKEVNFVAKFMEMVFSANYWESVNPFLAPTSMRILKVVSRNSPKPLFTVMLCLVCHISLFQILDEIRIAKPDCKPDN
ncbi:TMV resistance protein N isoform X2 [Cajanus cajan]|uniref:TMV resistance protein N isoform X2 n=1 Tax=Cajanus cajan TaxID=3821 RepID=UPI0010FBA806|nr:TMV resistance protein N isoform X2 [Cajanus cajan]